MEHNIVTGNKHERTECLVIRVLAGVLIVMVLYGVLFKSDAGIIIHDLISRAVMGQSLNQTDDGKVTVVIDAGHGGYDPGKVGTNGVPEKDINLAISKNLKSLLEQNDINVILTREDDTGVGLKERTTIMNSGTVDLVVSIHQNSYQGEACTGAQVFYYSDSQKGESFAKILQKSLIDTLDKSNNRVAKANNSYYILKNTHPTVVIVECGFLSNRAEADKLVTTGYQEKVAWAVHLGILQYLNENHIAF